MIQVKLKEEEIALIDIIRHPILGPEFIRNFNEIPEEPSLPLNIHSMLYYEHTGYQKLMLCDFNHFVGYCCARQIGKTESLIDKLIFYLINDFWPGFDIAFVAPNRTHMDLVFQKLRRWLQVNDFLKHLVNRGSVNSGSYSIRLASGGSLDCRIAGQTGTGQNVVGMHVPIVLIDEAAYFPWGTWEELQPILNQWMDGFQLVVAGVPDGRREKSVLYYVDQKATEFTHHRITSHMNPRYSQEEEERNLQQMGGIHGESYIHMVLGEHGSPTFSVFDRALMRIEPYDTVIQELRGADYNRDPQVAYKQILDLPALPRNFDHFLLGIDPGFTDPTAICGMYQVNEKWYQLFRLNWFGIEYPEQVKLIAYLDGKYNPSIIGIDDGSSGKALIQMLKTEEKYKDRKFKDKIIPIGFASTVTIGQDEDGNDLKVRTKQHGVEYLQQLTNNHKIVYSKYDDELLTEFERTTYTKAPNGMLAFRTLTERGSERGADHNLSAYLCGFLGWYLVHESLFNTPEKSKLIGARWIFRV